MSRWVSVLSLAAVMAVASPTASSETLGPAEAHVDRLVSLCRLWNAIRFFDPALADETDPRLDDALVSALPHIDDPDGVRSAARAMFASLGDPLERLAEDSTVDAPEALPVGEDHGDVRVVRILGYPSAANVEAYGTALRTALHARPTLRGIVVDLRVARLGSTEQIVRELAAWEKSDLISAVSTSTIELPRYGQRQYVRFPDESQNAPSTATTVVAEPATFASPGPRTHKLRVAFVADRTALLPDDALALANSGEAEVFVADDTAMVTLGSTVRVDAGSGLVANVRVYAPLAQPIIRTGDLPAAIGWVQSGKESPPRDFSSGGSIQDRYASTAPPDSPHRLLAAFRIWGSIQYFFPYFSLMNENWETVLRAALVDLETAATTEQYDFAIAKMYAHIDDSHGFMRAPAFSEHFAGVMPFLARDIGGSLTIVRVDSTLARRDGYAVGDVIESVDGSTVASRYAQLRPYVAASTPRAALEYVDSALPGALGILSGPLNSIAVLNVRGENGIRRTVRVVRGTVVARLYLRTRPPVGTLPGNVGYIDLQRLGQDNLAAALAATSDTRALIFDMRSYPRVDFTSLASHFAAKRVKAALLSNPVRFTPQSTDVDFLDENREFFQTVDPASPRYSRPVIVLIDARAISRAEHTCLFLEAAAHAFFVGEPTNGTDGDVVKFFVPGAIELHFSGGGVRHADGRPLQRVGIQPDLRVAPTVSGVRAGKDEILLAGLAAALHLSGSKSILVRDALRQEAAAEEWDARNQR